MKDEKIIYIYINILVISQSNMKIFRFLKKDIKNEILKEIKIYYNMETIRFLKNIQIFITEIIKAVQKLKKFIDEMITNFYELLRMSEEIKILKNLVDFTYLLVICLIVFIYILSKKLFWK